MKNLFKSIPKHVGNIQSQIMIKSKVVNAFRCKTVSTRKRAITKLKTLLPDKAEKYIDNNILSQWLHLAKNLTSNVSERFNRKIEKVLSGRYGLKSHKTVRAIIFSLWLKECIVRGKYKIDHNSYLSNLRISQVCQEDVDMGHIGSLFSPKNRRFA